MAAIQFVCKKIHFSLWIKKKNFFYLNLYLIIYMLAISELISVDFYQSLWKMWKRSCYQFRTAKTNKLKTYLKSKHFLLFHNLFYDCVAMQKICHLCFRWLRWWRKFCYNSKRWPPNIFHYLSWHNKKCVVLLSKKSK